MQETLYSLGQLAELLEAELCGDSQVQIRRLATLQDATPDSLCFLANPQYRKLLDTTRAGGVLLSAADAQHYSGNALIVPDPYLAYARLSHYFETRPELTPGVHATAVVDARARLDPSVRVGAHAVIEAGVAIGPGTWVGAQCYVGAGAQIGRDCRLAARVSLQHGVVLGDRVVIQSGAVVGSDGFGFANQRGVWYKIAQLGGVRIGDDVEIGANTTIDRGALADTFIGNGVKLDNQIQIAHNVEIGDHTAMAACVGISGSTRIGRHCMIAGGVGMVGHIEVCDRVNVTGMTMVTRSITEPGTYSSGTAMQSVRDWKKSAARIRQLDAMAVRLRELERLVERLQSVSPSCHETAGSPVHTLSNE